MNRGNSRIGFEPQARAAVRSLRPSKIREVANAGMADPEVLAFWYGEPDQPTAAEIRATAIASIESGNTFYAPTLGLTTLRQRIAAYLSAMHGPRTPANVAVTRSGASALMLAMQALLSHGDGCWPSRPCGPTWRKCPRCSAHR